MSDQEEQNKQESDDKQETHNSRTADDNQEDQRREGGQDGRPESKNGDNKDNLKQNSKTILKQIAIILGTVAIIITTSAAGLMLVLNQFAITPANKSEAHLQSLAEETLITIRPGERLSDIARSLQSSAIITNQYLFMLLAKYRGCSRKIQAGEYAFSGEQTPEKILYMLIKGKVKLHRFTIPEGFNTKEIAAVVENAGFGTSYDFMKLATDSSFIASLGIHAIYPETKITSLEGYLFPETYLFPAGTDQKKIISAMVARFDRVFLPEWRDRCQESGLSVHQMVILASIIEKETADASERPIVSSVFHNRLKLGMRLESDPTVIYGIPDFNGNITKKDLLTVTPYNTYAIYGLPSGPISNPGKLSLQAAIFPSKSNFIFFVSKKDTTHHFSKTLEEHNMAVRRYQLNR